MFEDKNKEINKKNNKNNKKLLLTIGAVLCLVALVIGITYAAWTYTFNGTATSSITTADLSLELLESDDNVISITDALPMSDEEGKQTDTFDFVVTSKTTRDVDIPYTINIEKLSPDTGYTSLEGTQVRVYLEDSSANQLVAPNILGNTTTTRLYSETHEHDSTHNKVQSKYKLRAWVDQNVDASNWNSSTKLQYKFRLGVTGGEEKGSTLKLGNYVSLTPDKSTYTIPGAITGYTSEQAPFTEVSETTTMFGYGNKYYCCSSTKPSIDQSTIGTPTLKYSAANMTRTIGTGISGKYCFDSASTSSTDACTAQQYVYQPSQNAFGGSSYTRIPSTRYNIKGIPVLTNQTITPSELDLWRVIDVHDDGTVDVVSEYVSTTRVYFKGITGYANYVGGLQTIAAQYAKEGYTVGTRMMGYDGQTLTISDTSAFDGSTTTAPSTTATPDPTTGTGQEYLGGVGGDTLYLKDYTLVSNVYKQDNNTTNYCDSGLCSYKKGTTTKEYYRLASRHYNYNHASNYMFSGRSVDASGKISNGFLRAYEGRWNDYSSWVALRPILTLKSGLTTSGGSGTKASPYTLS